MNRVKQCEYLRCDVCGLESPRLDRVLMPTWKSVLLSIFTLGFLGLLALITPVDTEPMCPGCDRTDELEPALQPVPKPKGYDEAFAEQRKRRPLALILGIIGPVLTFVLFVLFFVTRL